MRRNIIFIILSVALFLSGCDPLKNVAAGIPHITMAITNMNGQVYWEEDNWSRISDDLVYKPGTNILYVDHQPPMIEDLFLDTHYYSGSGKPMKIFFEDLKERCPDAYLEIYQYDIETGIKGKLVKRWVISESTLEDSFFNYENWVHFLLDNTGYESSFDTRFMLTPEILQSN